MSIRVIATVLGLSLLVAQPAWAAPEKIALLIGNTAYPGQKGDATAWQRLPNAVHDVALVSEALKRIGFEVHLAPDMDAARFPQEIEAYRQRAEGAKISLFYYAGHGFEFRRHSYLVPVNAANVVDTATLDRTFVDLEKMANMVAVADSNFFLIDACRTTANLVKTSSPEAVGDGSIGNVNDIDFAAGIQALILYSTARGRIALDAAPPPENNSPFALAVSEAVSLPQFEVNALPGVIMASVQKRTANFDPQQQPYPYGSVKPFTYLRPMAANPAEYAHAAPSPTRVEPIAIDEEDLASVDGPLLVARVLTERQPAEIEKLADRGDTVASYLISYMYAAGLGVPRDLVKARAIMQRPAALTPWYGKLRYADFLKSHATSAKDRELAVELYRRAADQGAGKALGQYAFVLMEGQLLAHDRANYDKGLALLRRSAERGYPYAMYALAQQDRESADGPNTTRLRALAAKGNPASHEWLCDLAARRADHGEALKECQIAAAAGSAIGQARLAIAYHDGLGTARSDDEARHWTRLALSQSWNHEDLRKTLTDYRYSFTRNSP